MAEKTALILEEDGAHRKHLASLLAGLGYAVETLDHLPEATTAAPRLVLLSLDLPGASPDWFAEPALAGASECLVMARDDDPTRVQRFMDAGASYFFSSALPRPPAFLSALASDLLEELQAGEQPAPEETLPVLDQFGQLRGSSKPMRKLFRVLRKVAPVDVSVLITGESGTGKELVARTLHEMGPAPDRPYVAVNCAAIPEDLFESELFGHEKGSFSGADKRHLGYFERAEGGTLFLDELVEMPPVLQAKLLRVLETGGFRRVGGEEELRARVRVIGATNVDPEEAVAQGRLREDLYFRVARFPLHLPPLRERGDDIRGLAQLFLLELNERNGDQVALAESAVEELQAYAWPGNVRELRSVLEHAFILAEGTIEPEHLPDLGAGRSNIALAPGCTVEEVERQLIESTLDFCDGDREMAAKQLGISVRTLYNRLRRYREDSREDSRENGRASHQATGGDPSSDQTAPMEAALRARDDGRDRSENAEPAPGDARPMTGPAGSDEKASRPHRAG